jgi:hypothetical protein
MDKKRIEIIVTALLVLVLVVVWINSCNFLSKRKAASVTAPLAGASASPLPATVTVSPSVKTPVVDAGTWSRCPFSGKIYSEAEGRQDLNLSGIMWSPKKPLAVINERVVKAGDKIFGSVVIEIRKDKVILNNGSADFELKLSK